MTFRDEGRSAFKGENIGEGGKLHLFLQMVDGGKISRDSALIVESFDRLSRLPITEASELFNGIIRRGLTVVFLSPERILNKESIDKNPFSLIEVLITGIRANEESQTKSRRVKDAVERRKEQTKNGKAILSLCPPWLELKDGAYHEIKDRVKVIKRIFELYLAGEGSYCIARTLNTEKVPTFGKGTTKKDIHTSDEWYKLAVIRILRDKRLIGYCSFNDSNDYYPVVIDEDLFYRAQSRAKKKPVAGRKQSAKAPLNLFKGLTRCGICGGAASRADKERFGYLHQYFCCENGRSGKGCKYISFKNQWLENSFFNLIDSNAFYGSQTDRREASELEKVQGELETATKQRDKFFRLIEDDENPSKMLVDRLKKAERLVEDLQAKVDVAKGMDLEGDGFGKTQPILRVPGIEEQRQQLAERRFQTGQDCRIHPVTG
jgi:DNA invertase Pin-like site-specific DNA recombinase